MNLKINWKKIAKVVIFCLVSFILACLPMVLSVVEYRFVVCILVLCIIAYHTFLKLRLPKSWFKVRKFEYSGFYGQNLPGFTQYEAKFESWTSDPGVAKWLCSDGLYRVIPTFAIYDLKYKKLPKQTYPDGKIIFGASSKS